MRRQDQHANRFRPPAATHASVESPGPTLLKGASAQVTTCELFSETLTGPGNIARSLVASTTTEAQQQQQRAERVKDAVTERLHFSAAADKYRSALLHPLSEEDKADAAMGLGECLQRWAAAHVAVSRAAALAPGILAAEAAACTEAASLCAQSVDAYAQVRDASGRPREDALVNSGNVLCQWAEYVATAKADALGDVDALLARACSSYDAAAAAAAPDAPADTELLCNWADALVRRAEGLAAAGDVAAAGDAYQRALRTYETACSGADVSFGDDVAGMVYNWGCALSSYATTLPGLDAAAKATALQHAATQLRAAAQLSASGDVAPLNALGDVLHDMADHSIAVGAPSHDVDVLLQRALDEGYLLALRVHRGDTDARVGLAEVRLAQARRAAAAGDTPRAVEWASASADAYAAALATPGALGTVSERCEVQYNFACSAANCGRLAEARTAIQQLLECGATSMQEVAADADLAPLR